jgi:hypothetical protein
VLGVSHGERPMLLVGRQRGVTGGSHTPPPGMVALISDGEQSNRSAIGVPQVLLAELHEDLLGNPLQCVAYVVSPG